MTAFARVEGNSKFGSLVWEIRSLNNRFLDIYLHLPDNLRHLENDVRLGLKQKINRGKLDARLHFVADENVTDKIELNQGALKSLSDSVSAVADVLDTKQQVDIMQVLSWPGIIKKIDFEQEILEQEAMDTLYQAVDILEKARHTEGKNLSTIILQKLDLLRSLVAKAKLRMPEVIKQHKKKLAASLNDFRREVDENRLEQEIAILAQKMDIDEEMDRLNTHIGEVENVFKKTEPIGRRLDFLMQELHRETNTLGSKSQDIEITATALQMKVIIEQMREQVQNIE